MRPINVNTFQPIHPREHKNAYKQDSTHTQTHTHALTHTHTSTHMQSRTHMHMRMGTHTQTYTHAHTHANTHRYACTAHTKASLVLILIVGTTWASVQVHGPSYCTYTVYTEQTMCRRLDKIAFIAWHLEQ